MKTKTSSKSFEFTSFQLNSLNSTYVRTKVLYLSAKLFSRLSKIETLFAWLINISFLALFECAVRRMINSCDRYIYTCVKVNNILRCLLLGWLINISYLALFECAVRRMINSCDWYIYTCVKLNNVLRSLLFQGQTSNFWQT